MLSHSYVPLHDIRRDAGRTGRSFEDADMLDALFVIAGLLFFLLTAAYADGCDRL